VFGTREPPHIGADLGNNRRGGDRARGRQCEQQLDRFLLPGEQGGKAHLDPMDRLLELGDVVEPFTQQLPMMGLDAAGQRQPQGGQFVAQASLGQVGQVGQDLWIRLPGLDGPQHLPSTCPDHIAGHRPQFAIGRVQHLVDAIDLLGAQFDERLAIACAIAQHPDRVGGEEAGTQQAVARAGSASHSLSLTSVLRPGNALAC
jgi:hypothetical protein